MSPAYTVSLLDLHPEILLHILSFLDIPDLDSLSGTCPTLSGLALDPVLHQTRLRVVAPSRVAHSLFGRARPSIGDLVHRNVMRGLSMERRWRLGDYLYSPPSVKQYENVVKLQRTHTALVLTMHLRRQASTLTMLKTLHKSHILPDVESFSPAVSRTLLPVMRRLKWSLQRDRLARTMRGGTVGFGAGTTGKPFGNQDGKLPKALRE